MTFSDGQWRIEEELRFSQELASLQPYTSVVGSRGQSQRGRAIAPGPYPLTLRAPAGRDLGPENERFAARLGRRTQAWREGWVVEYRFAVSIAARTP